MQIHDFKTVIDNYKVVFFDAYGVLKNYKGLIPGVENTFRYLKETQKEFYILTNDASRKPQQLADSYHSLGIKDVFINNIISSGMLAMDYLKQKVKGGKVVFLGTDDSAYYIETLGLEAVPISELDLNNLNDIQALAFLDDEGFDWKDDLNKTINLLRRKNIPVIVANTDGTYPVSKKEIAIAMGGLSRMIEAIVGKQFVGFGKPDSQMFIFAYEHIKSKNIEKKDILMVGDTLHTDILGGNKFGLDTVLVLSGNTQAEDVEVNIHSSGIIPTYICEAAIVD
ncbi:HAD-IIA family hydrolase [Emticicia sp. TH156]|uniref:HAD-IIA family hydrolase n=1 Tax=Emticicia sp. TH156 TaxID=2067454 RepID=UPI000C7685A8|nr:HAD-IIA family hydrolase [Emticicia sp. TH156]PLK42849.1 TIGR01459 family HAD-type hydrolase [Emticicia sp. TH156]